MDDFRFQKGRRPHFSPLEEERTVSIADVLPTLLKELKPKPHDPLSRLAEAWGEIMPAFVVEHCRPLRLQRDALILTADSHASSYELSSFYQHIIIEKLNAEQGLKIRRLRFVVE